MRDALPNTIPAWPSAVAGGSCVLIALLPMAPGVRAQGGDGAAMIFLALCGALVFLTPLRRLFFPDDIRDEPKARAAATFALLCAMSVLFPLARRYAPIPALSLRLSWSDEPFPISIAAVIALVGALVTIVPTWRAASGIVRSSLLAVLILAAFGLGSFFFLGRFYSVGPTEQVDPTPLVYLLQQCIEWGILVLLCHAATANRNVRRWVMSAMIVVLVLVWARQHTLPPLSDDE